MLKYGFMITPPNTTRNKEGGKSGYVASAAATAGPLELCELYTTGVRHKKYRKDEASAQSTYDT